MPGIDSYTKLLLHCNGTDGSTSFPDDSASNHSITAVGNAQVDTAQSKFGGASALFDNSGDYLNIPDSTDWDWGTEDLTIDCWVRFNSIGNNTICARSTSGTSYFYFTFEGTSLRFRDYNSGNIIDFARSVSISTGQWYHIAIIRTGSTFKLFLNGVQQGADYTNSNSFLDRSVAFDIGHLTVNPDYAFDGWIDEFRLSKGIARWTTDFTPPTEEYSSLSNVVESEDLILSDSLIVQETAPIFGEDLILSDSLIVQETFIKENENLILSDSINVTVVSFNTDASYASKIISINPLIIVTDTNPAEIVKIDTTDPNNPTWEVREITGATYAKDVAYNSVTNMLFVACSNGLLVKINYNDLTDQTIIDVSDSDNLEHTTTSDLNLLAFASTNNLLGELYLIDDRSTFIIDSNINCLAPNNFIIDSDFELIDTFIIDSNIEILAEQSFIINSDFKCLTNVVNEIEPIKRTDFVIYIDSVLLSSTDVLLNTINITHIVNEQSEAKLTLTRNHDKLDYDLDGNYRPITNQNILRIDIQGRTEFNGRIGEIQAIYGETTEEVQITAYADEKTNQYNLVTLPLANIDEPLNLYHILIENPQILNYYIDPNDDNPRKYKGIKVSLGKKIEQNLARYFVGDPLGFIADTIQSGTFIPKQNWTYFWGSIYVRKILDNILGSSNAKFFYYIGTSLSPVSEDLWELINASYRKQRIFENKEEWLGEGTIQESDFDDINVNASQVMIDLQTSGYIDGSGNILSKFKKELLEDFNIPSAETKRNQIYNIIANQLGYTVGEAPYLEISTRNGIFIPKYKWVDKENGLYSIREASYNYEEYAKTIANLEYQKLQNINGQILPETRIEVDLTIDAYYYYGLKLLTRFNIDNTIQSNIYKNNLGFPVSIKSIIIDSANMKTTLVADNLKSIKELEELNGKFPDEDDEVYITEEKSILIASKTDMRTELEVE